MRLSPSWHAIRDVSCDFIRDCVPPRAASSPTMPRRATAALGASSCTCSRRPTPFCILTWQTAPSAPWTTKRRQRSQRCHTLQICAAGKSHVTRCTLIGDRSMRSSSLCIPATSRGEKRLRATLQLQLQVADVLEVNSAPGQSMRLVLTLRGRQSPSYKFQVRRLQDTVSGTIRFVQLHLSPSARVPALAASG